MDEIILVLKTPVLTHPILCFRGVVDGQSPSNVKDWNVSEVVSVANEGYKLLFALNPRNPATDTLNLFIRPFVQLGINN